LFALYVFFAAGFSRNFFLSKFRFRRAAGIQNVWCSAESRLFDAALGMTAKSQARS